MFSLYILPKRGCKINEIVAQGNLGLEDRICLTHVAVFINGGPLVTVTSEYCVFHSDAAMVFIDFHTAKIYW